MKFPCFEFESAASFSFEVPDFSFDWLCNNPNISNINFSAVRSDLKLCTIFNR